MSVQMNAFLFLFVVALFIILFWYIYYRIRMATVREGAPVIMVENYEVKESDNHLHIEVTCHAYGNSVAPVVYLLGKWEGRERIEKAAPKQFITSETGAFTINLDIPLQEDISDSNVNELELVIYYNDPFGTIYESPVVKRKEGYMDQAFSRSIRTYPKWSFQNKEILGYIQKHK
ncbi:hypothetical protein N780_01170 [Pontibacillus chungwhensis BH030062]|uniref:Uncharacterized protein n=1 Tax=Pontibacillus chungwhensis BH030062 TaxID=1385513 RepID=A0A0A2VFJ7_9BACI|nr:hypothetical protein [Pontibacillus chungwhensis]KGP92370.1 hypothetical protein N780_01170 [Pontibacillus chungwhensis BH030062]